MAAPSTLVKQPYWHFKPADDIFPFQNLLNLQLGLHCNHLTPICCKRRTFAGLKYVSIYTVFPGPLLTLQGGFRSRIKMMLFSPYFRSRRFWASATGEAKLVSLYNCFRTTEFHRPVRVSMPCSISVNASWKIQVFMSVNRQRRHSLIAFHQDFPLQQGRLENKVVEVLIGHSTCILCILAFVQFKFVVILKVGDDDWDWKSNCQYPR